ncbi:MAG: ribokinase [Clostridia bacterium]|nr:ribokinase [Clostridia bacterium]
MILTVGSLNADHSITLPHIPRPGETVAASGVAVSPGGKGGNAAVAAGKLGGKVKMLGCVGRDDCGEMLLTSLQNAGVDISRVLLAPGVKTSAAYICVSADGENAIAVDGTANRLVTPDYILQEAGAFENADYCILQLEIPPETVKAALGLCKEKGVRAVFNPSPLEAYSEELLFGVDILIANETEAALIFDGRTGEREVRAFMAAHGISILIVTRGGEGSDLYLSDEPTAHIAAARVSAVDTTGAGDTFLGAFVAALDRGESPRDAAVFASRAAGIAVTRRGAQASMPTLEEVQ